VVTAVHSDSLISILGAAATAAYIGAGMVCLCVGALGLAGWAIDRARTLRGAVAVLFLLARYVFALAVAAVLGAGWLYAGYDLYLSAWQFVVLLLGAALTYIALYRLGLVVGTQRYRRRVHAA